VKASVTGVRISLGIKRKLCLITPPWGLNQIISYVLTKDLGITEIGCRISASVNRETAPMGIKIGERRTSW